MGFPEMNVFPHITAMGGHAVGAAAAAHAQYINEILSLWDSYQEPEDEWLGPSIKGIRTAARGIVKDWADSNHPAYGDFDPKFNALAGVQRTTEETNASLPPSI